MFGFGVLLGAGLELVKIHLTIGGISFYKTFYEKNMPRELESFEKELKERESRIARSIERVRASNTSSPSKPTTP
jgi:hypothetical protein